MDAASFKKMFLPYHRKLYGVALRLLENEDDAEDLLQEAYLKLWDKRDALGAVDNPEAFCITLVRNMCFDLLRSGHYAWSRQRVELTDALPLAVPDHTIASDDAQVVQMLIDDLPPQQRQVVRLRDVQGYPYEEIENVTGLSAVNIRVILSRARKKIREEFFKLRDYEKRRD